MKELQALSGLKMKITTKFNHELTRINTNKKTNDELVQIRENSWQKTGHRLKSKFLGSLVGTGAIAGACYGKED